MVLNNSREEAVKNQLKEKLKTKAGEPTETKLATLETDQVEPTTWEEIDEIYG